MPLYQLAYYSTPSPGAGDGINSILENAQRNNKRAGITGLLLYEADYFLQILEGERDAVAATYVKIGLDTRHRNPVVLFAGDAEMRYFADWDMRHEPMSGQLAEVLFAVSPTKKFKPSALSAEGARLMFKAISCHAFF